MSLKHLPEATCRGDMRKLKILIIEDEECIRDSLTWYLEDLGHQVSAVSAPFHCNVYRGERCPRDARCTDVLLIDQHLPELRGLDFIELLTQRGCKGVTRNIILMSGDTTSINMEKAARLGCTVVQKPMSFEFLDQWLEGAMARLDEEDA